MIHDLYMVKSRNQRCYLDNLGDARRVAEDIASATGESVSIYKQDPITEVTILMGEVSPGATVQMTGSGV
jgi:hypothetical protein